MDLLNEDEIADIREDVKSILEDCNFTTNIIYRRLGSRAFNPTTGVITLTNVDTEIKAFFGNHSAREVANSGGILQVGDEFFMFDPSLMSAFHKPDDRILRLVTQEGYVVLTNGNATLTGYNTKFLTSGVQGGDSIVVNDLTAPIKSVSAEDTAVLSTAWAFPSQSPSQFKIYRAYEIVNRIIDPLSAAVRLSVRRAGA